VGGGVAEGTGNLAAFVAANRGREVVVVQGLGFVGAAMVAALAAARGSDGEPRFAVIGVDLPDPQNRRKIEAVLAGGPPVVSADPALGAAYREARRRGNMTATADPAAFGYADVVVVDVNLDVAKTAGAIHRYEIRDASFRAAISTVADAIREDTLVVVETTVPPGTTERVVRPILEAGFRRRGLDPSRLCLAHSYERVMPGAGYLASITDYFRVFAGSDDPSRLRARRFLEAFINTREYPLFELESPTASETAKVLENSFRAANIALIQEWSELAQAAGIDLFRVIEAIRVRPTHRNIMLPGFGVGGYCLTKDTLLADWGARHFWGRDRHLETGLAAISINDAMPLHTLELIRELSPSLAEKRVAILGVSYLNDVADTRSSPTEILYDRLVAEGAQVAVHDSIVAYWPEKGLAIDRALDALRRQAGPAIVVFAVRHKEYLALDANIIVALFPELTAVVDANNVVSDATAAGLAARGILVAGVGKGHWRRLNERKAQAT
jgi:nucleotide sugar dehydrogenase